MSSKREIEMSAFVSDNLSNAVHLYKFIRVILTDDKAYIGWLKCVDPMTGTLILVTLRKENDSFDVEEVIFIQKSFIITIDVLKEVDPEVSSFLLKLYAQEPADVDEDRRDRLVAFIKANRMPALVSEDGRNISTTNCTIHPPYNAGSCMGSNPMVVRAVGKAIEIFDSQSKKVGSEVAKSNEDTDLIENPTGEDVNLSSATGEDVNLNSGMQNLKLAAVEADLPAFSTCDEKSTSSKESSFLKMCSDEFSDNEVGFVECLKPTSSDDSSDTEESYEFISNDYHE